VCGVSGLIHLEGGGRPDLAALARMNAALSHRGPDDAGSWDDDRVGLAHRRLSVIDPSPAGHQPMVSADGNLVVSFNGEIYNFRELREELRGHGCEFHTACDTEVLLEAYRVWGDAALGRLNGMFAFALYDRGRGRCLIARDRLGIKPLFYAHRSGAVAFASELGALRRSGLAGNRLNPAALDAYFTFLYIPAPDTIYEGILKLGPGEKLVVTAQGVARERYWQVAYREDARMTLEAAGERYRELLEDSVRLRRVSDVPLGAFLSGGLDSSTVAGVLSGQCAAPVKTFCIGFDDAHADELGYASLAARHFGTDHTEAILKPDMVALLPRLAGHFGEPFADSSALPMWLVSQVARETVTVALSGDGGDELFAGYAWAHMNHRVAKYRRVPAALRHLLAGALWLCPRHPYIERFRNFSRDSFLTAQESFRRRETCFLAEERAALYTADFGARVAGAAIDRFQEHLDACGDLSEDDQMLYVDTKMYLPDDILTKVDRMSMAHGLEARVPLLDHRLVEFAATVPFSLKYDRGISKRIAKHAVRKLLPPELLRQRKRGFSIPIHRWFREGLGEHARELLLSGDSRCGAYLERETVGRLLAAHGSGRRSLGHHLWALLVFEHWLRAQ